jgi:putative metallohydrolase (TIGR04338 family)
VDDPRRDAVYQAEHVALDGVGPRFARWTDVVAYVDSLTTDARWTDVFPSAPVEVVVERRSRSARYSAADVAHGVIHIRDGSWDAATVLHELAHLAVGDDLDDGVEEPHGERFVGTMLELVRSFLGFDAYGALRAELDRRGVPWRAPG